MRLSKSEETHSIVWVDGINTGAPPKREWGLSLRRLALLLVCIGLYQCISVYHIFCPNCPRFGNILVRDCLSRQICYFVISRNYLKRLSDYKHYEGSDIALADCQTLLSSDISQARPSA